MSHDYRTVRLLVDKSTHEKCYSWGKLLNEFLNAIKSDNSKNMDDYVVPVENFYVAPFAEYFRYMKRHLKVSFFTGSATHNFQKIIEPLKK